MQEVQILNKHFQIFSGADEWYIQYEEDSKIIETWCWGHNDTEFGVGGEKIFGGVLKFLGNTVYEEESY